MSPFTMKIYWTLYWVPLTSSTLNKRLPCFLIYQELNHLYHPYCPCCPTQSFTQLFTPCSFTHSIIFHFTLPYSSSRAASAPDGAQSICYTLFTTIASYILTTWLCSIHLSTFSFTLIHALFHRTYTSYYLIPYPINSLYITNTSQNVHSHSSCLRFIILIPYQCLATICIIYAKLSTLVNMS